MGSAHRPYAMVVAACLSRGPHERPDFDEIVTRLQALCEVGGGGGGGPVTDAETGLGASAMQHVAI